MAFAGLISLIAENIGGLGMSTQTVVILGLILGELSKAINNLVKDNTYL